MLIELGLLSSAFLGMFLSLLFGDCSALVPLGGLVSVSVLTDASIREGIELDWRVIRLSSFSLKGLSFTCSI